ncbi:hypothetical protein I4U23_015546 [Adineta vaga]|nr:hypothetical protein I4U23_015546 [Adineta vaga]
MAQHVMVCYEWGAQELASKVREYLDENGLLVWMDIRSYRTSDNLYEDIATAIENASCMVCFMTPDFQQSNFCKQELQYAKERNIPIIPLKLEQHWKPSGWLGFITAGLIRIDIDGTDNLDEKLRELYNRICVMVSHPPPSNNVHETNSAQSASMFYPSSISSDRANTKCKYIYSSIFYISSYYSFKM